MPLLEIRQINHFFGGLQAVHGFDLQIESGELIGLIGPNGAGKTTIFNLVSGFYKPTRGEILFQGKSILGLQPHQVTSMGLARTFQNIRMWNSMTVLENLCISQHYKLGYGLIDVILRTKNYRQKEKETIQTAMDILDILGLSDYRDEYPKNLPYGLQRRVEIGRALAVKPMLLLLDEPAAGMNFSDIDKLIELIGWIRERFKLTIWLIEHQMKVVMSLCERLYVLDFGKMIAEGTASEIRNDERVIKAYLGAEEPSVHAES